jgi:hypothetical protein
MSHSPMNTGLSRRQFVQAGGALLFAAQCPITFATKANAAGGGAMMNSFVRIDPATSLPCWRTTQNLVTAPIP